MESASAPDSPAPDAVQDADRTSRARIRDAAIEQFGAHGVDGVSLKAIAERVGVSPALIVHHFGSKDGLRAACDDRVVALVEEQKRRALSAGPSLDVFAALKAEAQGPPVLEYLARMISDGSPQGTRLVDGMVEAGTVALEEGVRSGVFKPVDNPHELNTVLVLWSLGLLVLREHAERLLGVDITGDAEARSRYVRVAMQALRGLFTEEAYEHSQRALAAPDGTTPAGSARDGEEVGEDG